MDWLLKLCGIPESELLNKSIGKEKIINHIQASMPKSFDTFNHDFINDVIYKVICRDNSKGQELHIIEVKLYEPRLVKSIAKALQFTIPYPMLVVFSSNDIHLLFKGIEQDGYKDNSCYSDWMYKEELTTDFVYGMEHNPFPDIKIDTFESWNILTDNISSIFFEEELQEYICVRRLMDTLKIREKIDNRKYINKFIKSLVMNDQIEFLNEYPFVAGSSAEALFNSFKKWWRNVASIEDNRYGIDNKYIKLSENELTTYSEVEDILYKFMKL